MASIGNLGKVCPDLLGGGFRIIGLAVKNTPTSTQDRPCGIHSSSSSVGP